MDSTNSYAKIPYLDEIGNIRVLTKEETDDLILKINNGEISLIKKLVYHNLKLVVFVAKKYINSSIPFEDLIQEGNIGLIKAVKSYDINKNILFSTYAVACIKHEIVEYINNNKLTIKVSKDMQYLKRKYDKFVNDYMTLTGETPKQEFVAKQLGISLERLNEVKKYTKEEVSLNETLIKNDEVSLLDLIEDEKSYEDIINNAEKNDLSFRLNEMVKNLTDKEQDIISLRYGLKKDQPMTLLEISKMYNFSVERVRKIESNSLRKLRKMKL